ncbi:polyribonucleotide nucleotidyltransferase [Clostridia bacterium]|nr:polyribonucleotide nucleotidyltransferase [Clostridia bacterium]
MFENKKVFETTFGGRKLSVETGKTCELSNGSCWVRYGDTVVMANVTAAAKPREGIDFFPLSVDYEERLYSIGKIPGSFMKREGKPSEKAVLTSRCIDRPFRPLFPKDMRNDVTIVVTVLSVDPDCSPEITGLIAASIAVSVSDIPWNGPISGVSVGLVDGELVINPTLEQRATNELELTLAASADKVVMIEAGAKQVPEDIMIKAIELGHEEIKKIVAFIADIQSQIGKTKFEFESQEIDHDLFDAVYNEFVEQVKVALDTDDKNVRESRLQPIKDAIAAKYGENSDGDGQKYSASVLGEVIYKVQKKIVREWLFEGKRVDGRGIDDIRSLAAEVAVLPRVHGSGLFTRGQTQVLTICTLGTIGDAQRIDGLDEDISKRYMHHYNFPSYSVGETRPSRGPGRREIGHGALAERALEAVLPSIEDFPYALRLVSEVLSSNGSTSQGSICGSTLALMDAGVPIDAPVAGISCGLIVMPDGSYNTMVDIQGLEDFYGDMDFKVGGTHKGITAIQVDIKVDGLSMDIIREAFEKTRKARLYILDEIMLKAIDKPRDDVSEFAPKMLQIKIPSEKIREVIGQGGKVIQKIQSDNNVRIEIVEEADGGNVFIAGINKVGAQNALDTVKAIVSDPELGQVFNCKVVRIMTFGAFVEFAPGKEGLVHVSKLDKERVEKVEDFCKIGDEFKAMIVEIDKQGRINLSRKACL